MNTLVRSRLVRDLDLILGTTAAVVFLGTLLVPLIRTLSLDLWMLSASFALGILSVLRVSSAPFLSLYPPLPQRSHRHDVIFRTLSYFLFLLGAGGILTLWGTTVAAIGGKFLSLFAVTAGEVGPWVLLLAAVVAYLSSVTELGFSRGERARAIESRVSGGYRPVHDIVDAIALGFLFGNVGGAAWVPLSIVGFALVGLSGDVLFGEAIFLAFAVGRILSFATTLFVARWNTIDRFASTEGEGEISSAWVMMLVGVFLVVLALVGPTLIDFVISRGITLLGSNTALWGISRNTGMFLSPRWGIVVGALLSLLPLWGIAWKRWWHVGGIHAMELDRIEAEEARLIGERRHLEPFLGFEGTDIAARYAHISNALDTLEVRRRTICEELERSGTSVHDSKEREHAVRNAEMLAFARNTVALVSLLALFVVLVLIR